MSRPVNLTPGRSALLWGHASGLRARSTAGALLVLSFALMAVAAWRVLDLQQRLERAELSRHAGQLPAKDASIETTGSGRLTGAERLRVNRVVRQLNAPWPAIFRALETEAAPHVAVLSVEPNAERGVVRVLTEGATLDDLLSHANRLGQRRPFRAVQLLRVEERDVLGRPLPRLNFDLALEP